MNEGLRKFFINNVFSILMAFSAVVIFIFSFLLTLRADLNTAQGDIHAMQTDLQDRPALKERFFKIEQVLPDMQKQINDIHRYIFGY